MRHAAVWPFALLLLLVFLAQGIFLIQHTSATTDEIPFHAVNGYVYLKTADYRMNPSSPALIREWMALPWLFLKPKLNLDKQSWREAETQPFAEEFFYKDNRRQAIQMLYASRAMVLLLGILLGFILFYWARTAYGDVAALTSLILYVFSPSFIAHSSIATTDVGTAFLFILSTLFLWFYLERGKRIFFFLFCIALGLTFAAKINTLIFGPIFILVASLRKGFRWFCQAALLSALISLSVVWAAYQFEFKPLLWPGVPRIDEKLQMIGDISHLLGLDEMRMKNWALSLPIPAPSYILAVAGILRHHTGELVQFSFGVWGTSHPWWLYFFLFAVKMSPPFLILFIARTFYFFYKGTLKTNDNLLVLLPSVFFFLLMCFEKTGHGHRYLLPVISILIFWMGGTTVFLWKRSFGKVFLVVLLLGHAMSGLLSLPNPLSYFNFFLGGPERAYRFVRDSDIDWGQGLKPLKAYLERNKIREVTLVYFGSAHPDFFGIPFRKISDEETRAPEKRVYAVSINYLEHLEWLQKTKPVALVGGSIFVYDER